MNGLLSKVLRELAIFALASLLLLGLGQVFNSRHEKEMEDATSATAAKVDSFWVQADAELASSRRKHIELSDQGYNFLDYKNYPLDELANRFRASIQNDDLANAVLRLKLFEWMLICDEDYRASNKTVADATDSLITESLHTIDQQMLNIYRSAIPGQMQYTDVLDNIGSIDSVVSKISNLGSGTSSLSINEQSALDTIRHQLVKDLTSASEGSQPAGTSPWEVVVFVAVSVFIFSAIVTMSSRFLARLVTALYLQDLLLDREQTAVLKLRLLPYLFSIPAFVFATLLYGTPLISAAIAKLVFVLAILVLAGGLSFELALKYLDQGRHEFSKPYARYLALNKPRPRKLGWGELLGAIFMPRRQQALKNSDSILPYIITGADYQLLEHVRRRMTVTVDSYALAGVLLSFKLWPPRPDLVSVLQEIIGTWGSTGLLLYTVEAVLLGLLLSKLLFIITEFRQFPTR